MTKLTNEEILEQIRSKKADQDYLKTLITFMRKECKEEREEIKRLVKLRNTALAKEKWDLAKRHNKDLLKALGRIDKLNDVTFELRGNQVMGGREILALRAIIADRRELAAAAHRLKDRTLTGARNFCTQFKNLFSAKKVDVTEDDVPELKLTVTHEEGTEGVTYRLDSNIIPNNQAWSVNITSNQLPYQPIFQGEHTMPEVGPLSFPYLPVPAQDSATRIIKITVFALDLGNVGSSIYLARRGNKWQEIKDGEYHWSRLLDSQSKSK